MKAVRVRGGQRAALAASLAAQLGTGRGITELAAATGHRPSLARRVLEEAGVQSHRHLIGLAADDVTAELVDRHRHGMSVELLSAQTGIDEKTIRACLRSAGAVQERRRRGDLTMTAEQLADAYRASDITIKALAELADGTYGTVRRILIESGVKLRRR